MLRRYRDTILTMAALLGLLAWAVWAMIQMWTSVEGSMGINHQLAVVAQVIAVNAFVLFLCSRSHEKTERWLRRPRKKSGGRPPL